MPLLRFLHRAWNIFWVSVISLLVLLVVIIGAGIGTLQLPAAKTYIINYAEKEFTNRYEGVLTIGSLDGFLPFEFQLNNINLYADSSSSTPVLSADTVKANIDTWLLFQRRVVVNGLEMLNPFIDFKKATGKPAVLEAFNARAEYEQLNEGDRSSEIPAQFIEVITPVAIIRNGSIDFGEMQQESKYVDLPKHWKMQKLNAEMFLQFSKEERYLDIERMAFEIPGFSIPPLEVFGQVYNNEEFFEFNAFNIRLPNSSVNLSGEASGVDVTKPGIPRQLAEAGYNLELNSLKLDTDELQQLLPELSIPDSEINISMQVQGTLDSLNFRELNLNVGDSFVQADGYANNLLSAEDFSYSYNLYQSGFSGDELTWLFPKVSQLQQQIISNSSITGSFSGNSTTFKANANIMSSRGAIDLNAELAFAADTSFTVSATGDSVDIAGLIFEDQITSSILNFGVRMTSNSLSLDHSTGTAELFFTDSKINGAEVDSLSLYGNWANRKYNPAIYLKTDEGSLSGNGNLEVGEQKSTFAFSGRGDNINFARITGIGNMASTSSDIEYEVELNGKNFNDIEGYASMDIVTSVVGEDTLDLHQVYTDLTNLAGGERRLRITSTPLDITMQGALFPEQIISLGRHWSEYLKQRLNSEITFNKIQQPYSDTLRLNRADIDLEAQIKDLAIVKSYFPFFPDLTTKARFTGNINSDSERLLFNIRVSDPTFRSNKIHIDSLNAELTGSFRYTSSLKDFSSLQLDAGIANFEYESLKLSGANISLNQRNDSVFVESDIKSIANEAKLSMQVRGALKNRFLVFGLDAFQLGNEEYVWTNEGVNSFIYTADEKLFLNNFNLVNDEQLLSLDGIFSENPEDSVSYRIKNLDIKKISDLINGRVDLSGIVNGNFSTRTLTRNPSIQGDLNVSALAVDERIIGDINLKSRFDQSKNRFDTEMLVITDSLSYPDYFNRTGRTGQNILVKGYINAPDRENEARLDTLFYFDVDFENIDMWVIPFIAPKVFEEMEGQTSGQGYIVGNLQDFDFNVDYQIIDAVYAKPRFLETFYYISGDIVANSERGLNFNSLFIVDPTGGTGMLDGYYDFTSYTGQSDMDINIEMDELQFLRNSFDPEAPFFGDAFGTGSIRLYGTNFDPVMESQGPVTVTGGTDIAIPLLEETEFNENISFIRKVTSFDPDSMNGQTSGNLNFAGLQQIDPTTLSFTERFTLDLQFISRDPITVRLIFDPVTGEVITSQGTGRIRITLQDQEVNMFGDYEVVSGSYQFVSGDVLSRRFSLEPGGMISWQGPPDDASLDVDAVFRTRTSVNSLSCIEQNVEEGQRVPVEIVLNLGGTLNSIENEFFFRIPGDFNIGQYSTFQTQINNLNATEDEKLIQASSLLISGNFIPTCNESNTAITERLSGGSAIINPLLSNQVISPLLSNQINALLNSDVSSLDIDFNLNAYNEVDLGVALRLYNNKLVLRREGQITGQQSTIGDLGATYRINRTISITAFHREDPTFGSFTENSSAGGRQDINGLGVEAQVEFNSGKDLKDKIRRFFNRLFGRKSQHEEPVAQNEN